MPVAAPKLTASLLLAVLLPTESHADSWVRFNQAGYSPESGKELVVMANSDLAGTPWTLRRVSDGTTEAQGAMPPSVTGVGPHTSQAFNFRVSLPETLQPGTYQFEAGSAALQATIHVKDCPYSDLLFAPLAHLRMLRSGSDSVPHRRLSHPGDAAALVKIPRGPIENGAWQNDPNARRVDALGGWYDAGDQIKFTLNHAYVVYHLAKVDAMLVGSGRGSTQGRTLLREELLHGVRYLLKVYPAPDLFVIQVGDALDHNQPPRLPEDDPLDGRRPALCALSRVHMGSVSAALAKAARSLAPDDPELAQKCTEMAERIFQRAQASDTVSTAFERDEVNDFYRDETDRDQLCLAAIELYRLTGKADYLARARAFRPGPAREVSWAEWNWLANSELAADDPQASADFQAEVNAYREHSGSRGQPWGIPGRYVWASLHRWIGAANASAIEARSRRVPQDTLHQNVLAYVLGRNNWGVSFLMSETVPNSVRNLYSPMYGLLGVFPEGALSEGPGDRQTHASLERYFGTDPGAWTHAFNTSAAVFFDSSRDFMCQEATMGGQADALLLLALADRGDKAP
ncbi:MAG: glycoside hydrolase family 9 protein [Opitutaceae bacterium]|nr:glycoside hydrolase family 9 protein [Opitutaceae bacterium]